MWRVHGMSAADDARFKYCLSALHDDLAEDHHCHGLVSVDRGEAKLHGRERLCETEDGNVWKFAGLHGSSSNGYPLSRSRVGKLDRAALGSFDNSRRNPKGCEKAVKPRLVEAAVFGAGRDDGVVAQILNRNR